MISINDIKHIQVSLKYANTGEVAVNPAYAPDRQTLFIAVTATAYFYQESSGNYIVRVPYWAFGGGCPMADTTYLVQIRFGSKELWPGSVTGLDGGNYQGFSQWRQDATTHVPSYFGEWSNIQKAYCYSEATTSIDYNFNDFMPEVIWSYSPVGDDPIEQVQINYTYNGLHGQVIKSEVFNGQFDNDNVFTLNQQLKVAPVTQIEVTLQAVTKNNTVYTAYINIPSVLKNYTLLPVMQRVKEGDIYLPQIKDSELLTAENEDGILSKTITLPTNSGLLNHQLCNVYRINTLTLDCLKIIKEQDIFFGEQLKFKDYTCEMGEEYQYVVCALKNGKVDQAITDPYPFGDSNPAYARLMKMEFSYLTTKNHQLRIAGNVSLSSFKRNTQDVFQTTIGGQYPFYSRASKMNYRTFTLGALITVNFDPTATFMRIDAWGTIRLNEEISYDKYRTLIAASPGLRQFFVQVGFDENKEPIYRFVGKRSFPPGYTQQQIEAEQKAVENFVNRCASTLILNGMWWDEDNGDSFLIVQDKDLLFKDEFSLSRRRVWSNREVDLGEEIVELGKEPYLEKNQKQAGSGPASIFGDYLHRNSGLNYGTNPTDSLIFIERKFREQVMKWLSNGKPKLFRSETEGNMIVVLSGVSFTPYEKGNRIVYTMSATVTEIAEFNDDNLLQYDLVPTSIQSSFVGNSEYDYIWGQEDTNVLTSLKYIYSEIYDIPNMEIGNGEESLSIDTYPAVNGGTAPYTFSATGLPSGITIQKQTTPDGILGGIIVGYPDGLPDPTKNIRPGIATLTVTDADGESASMDIKYGYMYVKLEKTMDINIAPKDQEDNPDAVYIVGQPIDPISTSDYFKGGVPPYLYTGINLPSGVFIDRSTGEITGAYSSELVQGSQKCYIVVTDYVGQRIEIDISYANGRYPLSFNKLPSWDYGYTEVTVPIPRVDLNEGVFGGVAPYEFTDVEGARLPTGWKISDGSMVDENNKPVPKGVIFGIPEVALKDHGQFTIQVTDATGASKQVTIYRDSILEEFKFVYDEKFDVVRDETTHQMKLLPVGTNVSQIMLEKGVSGGLKYTEAPHYRFEAEGLLPNFRISNYGEISGRAQVSVPEHQAKIYVIDARGERRAIKGTLDWPKGEGITVSGIDSLLTFKRSKFEIKGLRQGVPIQNSNVIGYDNDGNPMPPSLTIEADLIEKDGQEQFTIIAQDFPDGITIEPQYNSVGTVTNWVFTGTPTGPDLEKTGWLHISDMTGDAILIPVYFDEVIGTFTWEPFAPTVPGIVGSPVNIALYGLSGGQPSYNIIIDPTSDEWVIDNFHIEATSKESLTGWYFKGTVPDMDIPETRVRLIASDNIGSAQVYGYIIFEKITQRLKMTVEEKLNNKVLYIGVSQINPPIQVVSASGGTPPYTFSFDMPGGFPGGITFNADGTISGSPTKEYSQRADIGPYFLVTDKSGSSTRLNTSDENVWTPYQVIYPPEISTQIGGTPAMTSREVNYGNTAKISNKFTTAYLFEKVYTSAYVEASNLPPGLSVIRTPDNKVYVSGTPYEYSSNPITATVTVTIPENRPFNGPIVKTVTLKWDSILGGMSLQIPSTTEIVAIGVGESITPIDLGQFLQGGVGNFEWNVDPLPPGLSISLSNNGRNAVISGTATAKSEKERLKVTVTDRSDGSSVTSGLSFGGFYEPLVITGEVVIPEYQGGVNITPVDIKPHVSGGVPKSDGSYSYRDTNGILNNRGYGINDDGTISGKTSDESRAYIEGTITVTDSKGQRKTIPLKCGAINGKLGFDINAAQGPITIPAGRKGTSLAANELIKLQNGAVGGSGVYTYSEDPSEDGWKQKGFTCTMDSNGNFSAITRPSTAGPAGNFKVILTDGTSRLYIPIEYGEITD